MNRRLPIIVISVAAAAVLLAGCGGGGHDPGVATGLRDALEPHVPLLAQPVEGRSLENDAVARCGIEA